MADDKELKRKSEDPSTTVEAYDAMLPKWRKVRTVLAGTDAMRAAQKTYLPQHEKESDDRYAERLAVSVLHNKSAQVLDDWVGRPFGQPLTFGDEELPETLEPFSQDVDLQGNELQVFAREWFREGLACAFSHVYVDMPRPEEGVPRTAADDAEVRPYWVRLSPEQVFYAHAEVRDGREVLTEVRWREVVTEPFGFAEVKVEQIRRVFLASSVEGKAPTGQVEVYRLLKDKKRKEVWRVVEAYSFDLDEIPLVTFYAERECLLKGKPPIEDVVDLNVAHWQSYSDQRSVLTVARFPILAASGGSDDASKMVVGPYKYLYMPDPQGQFYYVEHTGAAIASGRLDLKDLEDAMAAHGAEFLRQRPAGETATARVLDAAEATSPLQDVTRRFAEAATRALRMTAKWLGLDEESLAVSLSTDFAPEAEPVALGALTSARGMRDISRGAYLTELKRRDVLGEEFDVDKDALVLERETLDTFGAPIPPTKEDDDEDKDEDKNKGGKKEPEVATA